MKEVSVEIESVINVNFHGELPVDLANEFGDACEAFGKTADHFLEVIDRVREYVSTLDEDEDGIIKLCLTGK